MVIHAKQGTRQRGTKIQRIGSVPRHGLTGKVVERRKKKKEEEKGIKLYKVWFSASKSNSCIYNATMVSTGCLCVIFLGHDW
jgi:hypothetical protein